MLVVWVFLAGSAPPARSAAFSQESDAPPADPQRAARIKRAEELLRELQRRPAAEVIPAASSTAGSPQPTATKIMPEGTAVISETGAITKTSGWWQFEPQGKPALKLLPNSTLEAMVRMERSASRPLRFVVSGELTAFGTENYLLPRSAVRASTVEDSSAEAKSGHGVEDGPARPPPSESEEKPEVAWDADAEEVLARMKQLAPDMPALVQAERDPAVSSSPRRAAAPLLEGSSLIARTGRLIGGSFGREPFGGEPFGGELRVEPLRAESLSRDGTDWYLAFDADHLDQAEAGFRLLPNAVLEFMIQSNDGIAGGSVFVVSGEITEFEGRNYLLARTAIRPLQTDNLRR